MIVSLSPPGVKCQVGDFVMLVDPVYPAEALASPKPLAERGSAKAGRPPKANLILRTRTELPIKFPLLPEDVAGAGEYEISGVRVNGINLDEETTRLASTSSASRGWDGQLLRTVYSVELEGVRLAFLGELGGDAISRALGKLGTVDILFLSVEPGKLSSKGGSASGGKAKQIATLIKQLDPKIIIPTGEKTAKLLAEELGQKVEAHEKLVIKKKDLDKEQIVGKLVWLKS